MQEIINAVVIDDSPEDLLGISTALAKKGISTIPIHYKGAAEATDAYAACKGAADALPRIIITDIQMNDGGREPSRTDLGNVAKCLEAVASGVDGPYMILAWTSIPNHFSSLKAYVETYFAKKGVLLPIYFDSICKNECKPSGGDTYCSVTIFSKFEGHLETQLQLRALLHWERTVLNSAIASVNDLLDSSAKSGEEVGALLKTLAIGVAGKNLVGFESAAVNEALSYLLKDKVSQLSLNASSKQVWKNAISTSPTIVADSAKHHLNSLLHFDKTPSDTITCPGDMWVLGQEENFFELIAGGDNKIHLEKLREEFFVFDGDGYSLDMRIRKAKKVDYKDKLKAQYKSEYTEPKKKAKKSSEIIAIEISPVCDFSNKKKALKTLVLGVIVSKEFLSEKVFIKSSDSIIICPILKDDKEYVLAISAKYVLSMADKKFNETALENKKILRVRESILQSWIHKISSYNSRIGTVSF